MDFIAKLYAEFSVNLTYIIKSRLYIGCPDDYVYDCLNDVFLIAIQKRNDKSLQENPQGWLVITARNVVDNFNRKAYYQNKLVDHSSDMQEIPQQVDMIEDYIYRDCLNNDFLKYLNETLSKDEKYLYYLRYSQKLSLTEISEKLNITPNAVNTRLHRLRNKIKEFIRKSIC